MSGDIERLIGAARDAAGNAYAPYSKYHVGAALLMSDGSIISAANFENASYGMTLCAETVAIAMASSAGRLGDIIDIAVVGGPAGSVGMTGAVTPCGRCRQIIKEAADISCRDIRIYCAHDGGYDTYLLSELLPHAFGPSNLK